MSVQEVPPPEQQEPTPPEKVEQLAAAYLMQEEAFVDAMVTDVLGHMDTVPQRFANKLMSGIKKQQKHNAVIAKFKIGEPVELADVHVVEIFLATHWTGWVVRIGLGWLTCVAIAQVFDAWILPPRQATQTQQVQIQPQQGE